MSVENVKKFFAQRDASKKILEFENSTATSEQAANVLNCQLGQIAKTLSVFVKNFPILILMSGDMKLDNKKFKAFFGNRPRMIPVDEVENFIGHAVGGVCPFAVNAGIKIFLDESLKRFEKIYCAAGSSNTLVELHRAELKNFINFEWIDVSAPKFL